jgi:hypothetical protein
MYLIKRLMDDIETESRKTAIKVEPLNKPIYRVIKEGISDYFTVMSKNFNSQFNGYKILLREKQFNSTYELRWGTSFFLEEIVVRLINFFLNCR